MTSSFFIDVDCKQIYCGGERIGGDSFICQRIQGGRRTVAVLSDGMGHGVKANILSTLTSAMLLNFIPSKEDVTSIARTMLSTLPVCSVRKISYSTFTIIDIDNVTGFTEIVEYDNPQVLIFRDGVELDVEREKKEVKSATRMQIVYITRFYAQQGDRFILMSDGVTQSGQRTGLYKFGWGADNIRQFATYLLSFDKEINSHDLALQLLSKASRNDGSVPSDDMSCAAFHIRVPRKMILVSCPPASRDDYHRMVEKVDGFIGTKVVCGYPVAEMIADIHKVPVQKDQATTDPLTPPAWKIKGFEMVTEGIITLSRVLDILERNDGKKDGTSTAGKLCRLMMRHDQIEFVIGTKRDVETGLYMPDEFELRRNILRRIMSLLETKYGKHITVEYI